MDSPIDITPKKFYYKSFFFLYKLIISVIINISMDTPKRVIEI
jgi:hypothetical protein